MQRRMALVSLFPLLEKLVFSELSFEEKKAVAAQFIRRIEVAEDSAEIIWAV